MPPASSDKPRRLSILVVDDHEDAAESAAELMTVLGHAVRVARSGEAALREAAAATPDVILLDIGLPRLNGWEVARQVRAQASAAVRPYIVAVTGYGTPDDRRLSAEAGIDVHLVKPADPQILIRLLALVADGDGRPDTPSPLALVRVCAWCGEGLGGDPRAAELGNRVAVTHGMCRDCFQRVAGEPWE
jgi:CheY-like chemotaxis protein